MMLPGSVVAVIILHWSEALAMPTTGLINGPEPMSAIAPLGATVTFTCVANTTELPLLTMIWKVNGTFLSGNVDQLEMTNGSLEISVLQLPVSQNYLTASVLVQCAVVQESTVFMSSSNATLTAYGKII